MILTDREIAIALKCGQLIIDPSPVSFTSTSIDLTLSDSGLVWEIPGAMQIFPGRDNYKYSEYAKTFLKSKPVQEIILTPQTFFLSWTKEHIELPITSKLAARVEGKSSLARLGVGIHITAPTIHAGFRGVIQLEFVNSGPFDIGLEPGMKICQLIVEQTSGTPQGGYDGQFLGQRP
jgi:dCTP deaminase